MKIIRYLYWHCKYYLFFLLIIINIINLSGCNKNLGYRQYHIVKNRETLYSISKKYNVKLDHLAERNRLKFPFILRKGQKLIIVTANSHNNGKHNLNNIKTKINSKNSNVVSRDAIANNQKNNIIYNKPQGNLIKPQGNLIKPQSNFIKNSSINRISWGWPAKGKIIKTFIVAGPNKVNGIDIAGKKGDLVLSAANGRVVYSGNNLRGYGNLVIIKHNEDFLSAYAHNEKILVKEQQIVTKGQKIATMGDTDANRVVLHFEVRYKGKPIDPLKVLGIVKTNY